MPGVDGISNHSYPVRYIHLGAEGRGIVGLLGALVDQGTEDAVDGATLRISLHEVLHDLRPEGFQEVSQTACREIPLEWCACVAGCPYSP